MLKHHLVALATLLFTLSAPSFAGITELSSRGHIPQAPRQTPEGLACDLPKVWQSERVNIAFPKAPLVIGKDRVYTASDSVTALDRATGEKLWRFVPHGRFTNQDALDADGSLALLLDDSGEVLYFGGYQKAVYALNAKTGEEIWHTPTMNRTGTGIVLEGIAQDKIRVYAATPGRIYALDKKDGSVAWEFMMPENEHGQMHPPQLADDGTLYTHSGFKLYALDAKTGHIKWSYEPPARPDRMEGHPRLRYDVLSHIYKDWVFVVEIDGMISAVNRHTGKVEWQVDGNPITFGVPYFTTTPEGNLIVKTGANLMLLDIARHKIDWWFSGNASARPRPVALYKNLALFGTDGRYIYALNRTTGDEVFRHQFDRDTTGGVRTLIAEGDVLYFLGLDGRVYAYRLACPQLEGVDIGK